LQRLNQGLRAPRLRWVVEADIVGYFDHVNHAWLREFVRHRVNDGGLLRLLGKWLKAGVLEHGVVTRGGTNGTPQGGPISPVLANIYLHYALDLWFEKRFQKTCRGVAQLTRYADDFVAVFEDEGDARRYREALEERLHGFGLQVAAEKTAIVPFDRRQWGRGGGRSGPKPGRFTLLGFTHVLMRTRRGQIVVGRTPSVAARERFVAQVGKWLKAHRHVPEREQQARLARALHGFYEYFGLRRCVSRLNGVRERIRRQWYRALRSRSQRARRTCTWATLAHKSWFQLPTATVRHAWV
jgi:group II intron reverse transcriptase/maturase